MVLRRGAVLLLAFLVVVSCQSRQDLLKLPTEPSLPTPPSNIDPESGPLDFIMMHVDDNAAFLFGYELLENIRTIQVECVIQKREEELDFNGELDGLARSYQAAEKKISKFKGISDEEKQRVEKYFRNRFGGMNEERTAELALLQRKCDRELKRLLDSKKMEATGYAEALLKTDPAEFAQLLFDITDYRRQLQAGLDSCLRFFEGELGKLYQQGVGDPADLCYQDAFDVLLQFVHQLVAEISQLPEQIYGDDEDFAVPGSGEGVAGSGEPPPRVVDPAKPPTRVFEPIDDSREIVRIHTPYEVPPSTRPVKPGDKKPSKQSPSDSKEEPTTSQPATDSEEPPSKDLPPTSDRPTGTAKIPVFTPSEEEGPDSKEPSKTPPSKGKRPFSDRPDGPTNVRVATPEEEEEEPDSKEPSKTPPSKGKRPFSDRPDGPTNVRVATPSDEKPSFESPTTEIPSTTTPRTKATLPPKFTFPTRQTEPAMITVPDGSRVSKPTLPSKTEEPQKERPSEVSDEGEGDDEGKEESPTPAVQGMLDFHLLGVGVDVQVGVDDDGVEVDVDVTTETSEDGEESESVPDTTSDDDSEEGSERHRPEHRPFSNTDEQEAIGDEDSSSEEEEEGEGFNYQHVIIYAFMVVGSLLVIIIVILVVTILAVRRKRNSLQDSPLLSEEQKVAIMKQSGYVNPTYKFFDQVNDS